MKSYLLNRLLSQQLLEKLRLSCGVKNAPKLAGISYSCALKNSMIQPFSTEWSPTLWPRVAIPVAQD